MGENNVLSAGTDVLNQMRESLVELDGYKKRIAELTEESDRLEKAIELKQKYVADEITLTLEKRQAEVGSSFDGQIDKTRSRIKKVKAKRDKFKDSKMSERIELETADFKEEKRRLQQDLKAVFKINQIPRIFNTGYFFSMFMPSEIVDFMKILLTILFAGALPLVVNFFIPEQSKSTWLIVAMYAAVVVLFMFFYILIFKRVKERHTDALIEAKAIRVKLARNRRHAARVQKEIKKDKDESHYDLERFDVEIKELEQQVIRIMDEKKEALTVFEKQTKSDITAEIKSRYEQELTDMRTAYDSAYNEQRTLEDKVNAFVLDMSRKYEAYVGKEAMSISMIDSLIEIINTGDALTIADALVCYRKQADLPKEES